jgi:hypothetical protein
MRRWALDYLMSAFTRMQNFVLGEPSRENRFRRQKLGVALAIMSVGMFVALAWAGVQGWGLGRDYPGNTILLLPFLRFGDYSDLTLVAQLPNPYLDPTAFYLPFQWLCLRSLAWMPLGLQIGFYCFVGLAVLFIGLEKLLQGFVDGAVRRALLALLLLALSYPVLFCFDRANVELVVAALVVGAIYLLGRTKYFGAAMALAVAMSIKPPAVLLLILLVRQRRTGLAALSILVAVAITLLSLLAMSLPFDQTWTLYLRNTSFQFIFYAYQNNSLEGSASPWNALKVLLLAAGHWGVITPVNFNYDGSFVRAAFKIYSLAMLLLAAGLALNTVLLERCILRGAIPLLLFLSLGPPEGSDYRLLYTGIALALLISLVKKRRHDILVIVLLVLVMVPKKEIFLPFAGESETGALDVSIQVLLNPVFILIAIFLLLWGAKAQINWRWSQLRLRCIVHGIFPSRFVWLDPKRASAKIAT